jgi:pentatricopeptide repeat protein
MRQVDVESISFFSFAKNSGEIDPVKVLRWNLLTKELTKQQIMQFVDISGLSICLYNLIQLDRTEKSLGLIWKILDHYDLEKIELKVLLLIAKKCIQYSWKEHYKKIYQSIQQNNVLAKEQLVELLKFHRIAGDYDGALYLYQNFSFLPWDPHTIKRLVSCVVRTLSPKIAVDLLGHFSGSHIVLDRKLLRLILCELIDRGYENELTKLIPNLGTENTMSYFNTILLRKRLKRGQSIPYTVLVKKLDKLGYIDEYCYIDIIDGLTLSRRMNAAKQLYFHFLEKGFEENQAMESALAAAQIRKYGSSELADVFFSKHNLIDRSCYNRIMTAYLDKNQFAKFMTVYEKMHKAKVRTSSVLLEKILGYFIRKETPDAGCGLYEKIVEDGATPSYRSYRKLLQLLKYHRKAEMYWKKFDDFVSLSHPNFPPEYIELKVDYLFTCKSTNACDEFIESLPNGSSSKFIAYAVLYSKLKRPQAVQNTFYAMEQAGFTHDLFTTILWIQSSLHLRTTEVFEPVLSKMAEQRIPLTPTHVGMMLPVYLKCQAFENAIVLVQYLESLGYNMNSMKNQIKLGLRKHKRAEFVDLYTSTKSDSRLQNWFQSVYPIESPRFANLI